MTLYEMTGDYLEILELMEDPEADPEQVSAWLEELAKDIDNKFDGYMKVYRELETKEAALSLELERLQKRKKTVSNNMENIKSSILQSMLATSRKKIQTDLFSATVKNTAASVVIDIEEDIPEEFLVPQDPKVDKKGLKEFLKENDVEYAHLENGKCVVFK